jgi:CheY-like chemotaxis protein
MARVLVVEDDLRLKLTYDILLQKEGHTVERAVNGEEALEKMATFNPDLVLLDMMMPRMTGLQFLEAARVRDNYPDTKVIVFSNKSAPAEMNRAYELGAAKYKLKSSTSPKQLAELIEQTLAGR